MALQPVIKAPLYSTTEFDDVPVIDASAVLADDGSVNVFVLDRSVDTDIRLTCDLRAFEKL